MIDFINKGLCTGCNACFNICPVNSIEMKEDELGFSYPSVDYDKCIKCKKCIKTCPSLSAPSYEDNWEVPQVYAAWSKDDRIRMQSTSGGIFTEVAKEVISENGVVVGAKYNKYNMVEHIMIDSLEDIAKLRQSKYVQSDIGDVLKLIKDKLDNKLLVMFCGSPCQVAGLKNYLGEVYDNLLTLDFVCLGTNSPKAYRKYLEMLEDKYKSSIKRVWFKNKTYGWNNFSTRVEFENGRVYLKNRYNDIYMRGYIEEKLFIRPCCADCKYKGFPRISDISMADFWGVSNKDATLDNDKGTSLILVNSIKGEQFFNKTNKNLIVKRMEMEDALPGNRAIIKSVEINSDSEAFLKMLTNESFDKSFYKYATNTGYKRIISKIRRYGYKLKKLIKH